MATEELRIEAELKIETKEKAGYLIVKRLMDMVLSFVGLIILIPLFLVLALIIKTDDPHGPVIFSQHRVGKDGELFRMYKFRSMYADAEERLESLLKLNEIEGAMFKMREDPRVTRIGKFIRRTSMDELPQLFNVLIGSMSLVGPRPALPREVAKYTEYDRQRLLVTPGITGLWQVSGRNALSFDQMVELDLKYIKEREILKDLQIILKTGFIVLKKENAF